MKTETLNKRLEKRYNGSKTSKAYRIVKDLINGTNKTFAIERKNLIRPVDTSGAGRFTSNLDYTNDVEKLLALLGVKYESGNDAPRGGKTGNFIKVLTKID